MRKEYDTSPGSAAAKAIGCTCPVNYHGHTPWHWVISGDCPTHTASNPRWAYPTTDEQEAS